MYEVTMGAMGAIGFQQSWRCLAYKMASCDSPSVEPDTSLAHKVSHNNWLLTSQIAKSKPCAQVTTMQLKQPICFYIYTCKNRLVVLTPEWLPWLHDLFGTRG